MSTIVLPPEILDLIVDHLHDDQVTLKNCCLVSKVWVSRARSHLFARVEFTQRHIESWKELFPDPSTSPARHTRILVNRCLDAMAPELDVATWIHSFHRVTELELGYLALDGHQALLIQLHRLSPTLTSLLLYDLYAPVPEILDLICSFPLLENLALHSKEPEDNIPATDVPSTSPKFTGFLDLYSDHHFAHALLRLPDGLHFSKITVFHRADDWEVVMELVSGCSDTLESLAVDYLPGNPDWRVGPPPLDLSRFPKLQEVRFGVGHNSANWVTATLEAGIPRNLRRIAISHTHALAWDLPKCEQEWGVLDRLLVSLRSSRSILLEITPWVVTQLLPELASMGVVFKDCGSDD